MIFFFCFCQSFTSHFPLSLLFPFGLTHEKLYVDLYLVFLSLSLSLSLADNTVSIENSTFSEGSAFLGTGMFLRFHKKATGNRVLIANSRFLRNNVTQEGAAVLARFEGYKVTAQRSNCIVAHECLFVENSAGPKQNEWKNPGVFMVLADKGAALSQTWSAERLREFCGPKAVELRNCTFRNNTAFGSFFGRNTVATFKGIK